MKIFQMLARFSLGTMLCAASLTVLAQSVSSFTVVNADTNTDIATFTSSGTISITNTPRINVRANASAVASVVFTDGTAGTNPFIENSAPYAYKGDTSGRYKPWSPAPGTYIINASPRSATAGQGTAGPTARLTLTIANTSSVTYNYEVVLGHDGAPDPDDNLAQLAGYVAAKWNASNSSNRVKVINLVFGDTQPQRKVDLLNNGVSKANREYFYKFSKPALSSLGLLNPIDVTTQAHNYTTSTLTSLTAGGQLLAQQIRNAIGSNTRVVYSAGGGENVAAEAVAWLRTQGYSDIAIKNNFAVVQHSIWNWDNATDAASRTIIGNFTIRIEDQNPFSGLGKPPVTVSAAKTSASFVTAWQVCQGSLASGITNFQFRNDASDAGSHSFATSSNYLDANWNTRNNITTPITYRAYGLSEMNLQMN
jgi:hypothetical protein